MRLKSVHIRNFRSIKELGFDFPVSNFLVLVGPNNAGKSNIIKAIDAICGETWFGKDKVEDHDFYLRNRGLPFEITLSFDDGSVARLTPEGWPTYCDARGRKMFPRTIKEDFPCTYLGADRTFEKHLAFYDWTLVGKIRKRFHQKALRLQTRLQAKFEELTRIFDEVEGFVKFKRDFAAFFQEMQADTPARLDITFKPFTPGNYFKTMQILASDPNQSDEALDLQELGEGSRNTVLLALLRSYAVNFRGAPGGVSGILALEEPEIFLHPQARRHLYGVLRDIAAAGIQVMISTHSASFIDTENFDSIGQVTKSPDPESPGRTHTQLTLVSKDDLVKHCRATGVPAAKVSGENITEFYRTTSNYRLNEAFFAKYVILVEGETEELALPEYLRTAGIDCDLRGVSTIAVEGKNQIPKYWRLFGLFNQNLLAVADSDVSTLAKQDSNANLCQCFGVDGDAIAQVDGFACIEIKSSPRTQLIILEENLETAIRKDFGKRFPEEREAIERLEEEARKLIKPVRDQNKGQIARYVARQLRRSHPDFVPGFVEQIAVLIRQALDIPEPDGGGRPAAREASERGEPVTRP